MAIFDICLSKTRCNDIPSETTRRGQENEIASNVCSVKKSQVQEFVELVGKKGHSFCPSTFINVYRRKDTFKQTQLFALFFNNSSNDNKKHSNSFSFDDIAQRARQYNLPIFLPTMFSPAFRGNPTINYFVLCFSMRYQFAAFEKLKQYRKPCSQSFQKQIRSMVVSLISTSAAIASYIMMKQCLLSILMWCS